MSKNDGISGFVSDKLDKNNFHAWKFRMTNFLIGKGYWVYIDGNQEEMPELPDVNPTTKQIKAFKDWNQGARKVMYWLSVSVQDTMIGHIQDATSPKQAWDRFVSVDTTNTKARKIQLKNELNTVKKENLSINDYTLKIKDLVPMLVVEEKNLGEDSSSSKGRNNSEGKRSQRGHKNYTKEIIQIMKTENAGVVEEQVILNMTVHQETKVAEDSKTSASNHMTNHGEGFEELQALQNPDYVETVDDTAHPIAHTGNVPLSLQDGNVKYLPNVLHVPNITKNLVSIGQMVEQGLQVRFNAYGLYVEEYKKNGKLIAQGKKVDRMCTLDVNIPKVNAAMFAHDSGVVADIEIWHKRTGHVNVQRLKTNAKSRACNRFVCVQSC
ncbi:hypothetical protein L7F22_021285 [Adiantum nelumboides]|nr:hypothetical protein [Adiantum nelumboides]